MAGVYLIDGRLSKTQAVVLVRTEWKVDNGLLSNVII